MRLKEENQQNASAKRGGEGRSRFAVIRINIVQEENVTAVDSKNPARYAKALVFSRLYFAVNIGITLLLATTHFQNTYWRCRRVSELLLSDSRQNLKTSSLHFVGLLKT